MFAKSDKGFVGIAILVAVILIIGGGGAYYFYTQVQTLENTPKPTESSDKTPAPISNVQEQEGEEEEVETITLEAVGNYSGSGEATRSFDGEEFTHTASATLEEPNEGKFYEGWLVTKDGSIFISTGKLTSKNATYTLEFRIDKDYSNYPKVVITEETEANGLDGIPEDHVLEGSF